MARGWKRAPLLLGGIALLFAALAATAAGGTRSHAAGSVNVAFIYPKTGGLAAFGQEEFDGFNAGLAYTQGKCGDLPHGLARTLQVQISWHSGPGSANSSGMLGVDIQAAGATL